MRAFSSRAALAASLSFLSFVDWSRVSRPLTMGLVVALGAGCVEQTAEPEADRFRVVATSVMTRGAEEPGVARCSSEGEACSPLKEGDAIEAGGLVKTSRGARATLALDDATRLELLDETRVALAEDEGHRTLTLAGGTVLLEREALEDASEEQIKLNTNTNTNTDTNTDTKDTKDTNILTVVVAGTAARPAPDSPVIAAIRTSSRGGAVVTVRRGRLLLKAGEGEEVALLAGETAKLLPGETPDKRAAWVGAETPIEPIGEGEGARTEAPVPRGLGTLTARAPGTTEVVAGVRLVSHKVNVVVRDGYARTEIEEEFFNETPRVLEGKYIFPLPPDASISRLALWVGNDLVEGEVVERKRAAAIFHGIVEDTVRPRDPALLEWISGGEFSLKIFPIPAKSSRKVVLAYNQALPSAGGRVRYVYPLSLGADRTTTVDDFSISVTASDGEAALRDIGTRGLPASIRTEGKNILAHYSAKSFTPVEDFELAYERERPSASASRASVAVYTPREGEFLSIDPKRGSSAPKKTAQGSTVPAVFNPDGDAAAAPKTSRFVSIRMEAGLPEGAPPPAHIRRDIALVIDTSHSQSRETLEGEIALAAGLLGQMDPDERFFVLACDSACSAYPESGLTEVTMSSIEAAGRFLRQRTPGGASDIAGALIDAARRLPADGSGQLLYIGDGAASAGELSAGAIAERAGSVIRERKVDVRLIGAGRTVDEVLLEGLAQRVGATYEPARTDQSLAERAVGLGMALRAPVIRGTTLSVPPGLTRIYPKTLPSLRLGQEVRIVALAEGEVDGDIGLEGELGGAPYSLRKSIKMVGNEDELQNPLVPRLWAEARIRELEASGDKEAALEAIELSKRFHVMSRHTSLLVLENDRMFAEFGIRRTTREADDLSDHAFGAEGSDDALRAKGAPEEGKGEKVSGLKSLLNGAKPGDSAKADDDLPPASSGGSPKESFGAGGLGLSGIGEGGGGRGEGIGLGSVGSIGRGAGTGTGQGFGSGHGRLGGSHRVKPPQVRMGATSVSGRLPPEIIQRIVRQNFGRFRLCYENGLRSNPNLRGRVAVRFMIGQEGRVASAGDGGSDLPDSGVVSCVVRAFFGLMFPAPEGGTVTVVYPIIFSPGEGGGSSWSSPSPAPASSPWRPSGWALSVRTAPSAVHRVEASSFAGEGESALQALLQAVERAPESRRKHENLIRGLLARGRFYDALVRARQLADLDPDRAEAQELVAFAAITNGDRELALLAMGSMVELSSRRASTHARAARAFEAAGDERRACAHWRSLAELSPDSADARYQALRCRARMLDERDQALKVARSLASPGPAMKALIEDLEAGRLPRYEPKSAVSALEAKVRCEGPMSSCPTAAVVAPNGTVYSPFTPAAAERGGLGAAAVVPKVGDGTYRTFLIGGDPGAKGELELNALGSIKKLPILKGGARTVAATVISGVGGPFSRF